MPQALPAIVGIGKWLVGKTLVAALVRTVLINITLSAVSAALTKRPRQSRPPLNVTVRGTIENRRLVFGTRRVGGVMVFYAASGANNKHLSYVVALTGHQVTAITDVWLDSVRIPNASIDAGTGLVTAGQFANRCYIFRHLGTSAQTVDTGLDNLFAAWTTNHRLQGCAYLYVYMDRNDAAFPGGAPQSVSALVDGVRVYDPRLDDTNGGAGSHRRDNPQSWQHSRNPALILRWYLSGGSVHNDTGTRLVRYGLQEDDACIDDAYVIAAANACDEAITGAEAPPSGDQVRYACDLEVSCGETRREIIEAILATMAGTLVNVHGKWRMYAGAYDAPLHALTEADLYGAIEVQDTTPHAERYNAVAGVFVDAGSQYVEATTEFRTDAAYEAQDGGKRLPRELDLRGVTDQYRAQRLAEIELRRSRMMRGVKLTGALNLLKIAPHETFTLTYPRYGWTNRVFRCIERQFEFAEEAGRVVITARAEDAAVYADMLTADYTTGTSDTDVFQQDVPEAPSALTAAAAPGAIVFTVTLPAWFPPGSRVELWEYTSSTPFASASKVAEAEGSRIVLAKGDETTRYYWSRIRNGATGQLSSEYPSGAGVAAAAASPIGLALYRVGASGATMVSAGATLQKVGGVSAWDSSAYSFTAFSAGCMLTFRAAQTNASFAIGFNTDPTTDAARDSIDYAWHPAADGNAYVYEGGTSKYNAGSYTTSTEFGIYHDGPVIRYTKDGATVHETAAGVLTLYFDSSFYTPGAMATDIRVAPYSSQVYDVRIVQDPQFQQSGLWTIAGTNLEIAAGAGQVGNAVKMWGAQHITANARGVSDLRVSGGEIIRWRALIKANGDTLKNLGADLRVTVLHHEADGSNPQTESQQISSEQLDFATGTWTQLFGHVVVRPAVSGTGARYARLRFESANTWGNSTTNYLLLDSLDADLVREQSIPRRDTGGSRNFDWQDLHSLIEVDSASAVTLTLSASSAVNFPIGSEIAIQQYGAGTVTIAPDGSTALYTPTGRSGSRAIEGQYATVAIKKTAPGIWIGVGRWAP